MRTRFLSLKLLAVIFIWPFLCCGMMGEFFITNQMTIETFKMPPNTHCQKRQKFHKNNPLTYTDITVPLKGSKDPTQAPARSVNRTGLFETSHCATGKLESCKVFTYTGCSLEPTRNNLVRTKD